MTDRPDFTHLDSLKARLDSFRPLSSAIVLNLHEDLVLRWTYNSNAIEGNTLTLLETKVVLEGITIGGKSLREHFEAINHREAINYVESLVAEKRPFSEHELKSLQRLILKNIDEENAGRYRTVNVQISGARHRPPEHFKLLDEMEAFFAWYQGEAQSLHPVHRAADLHSKFVKIHPFVDGNGRTARLLMNLELIKAGFPPSILQVERRMEYYEALDRAHVDGDELPFLALMADIVEQSFEPYWFALGMKND
ncbi:MAG: Fic family protein [Spirochaetota bacterium]